MLMRDREKRGRRMEERGKREWEKEREDRRQYRRGVSCRGVRDGPK